MANGGDAGDGGDGGLIGGFGGFGGWAEALAAGHRRERRQRRQRANSGLGRSWRRSDRVAFRRPAAPVVPVESVLTATASPASRGPHSRFLRICLVPSVALPAARRSCR